MLNGCGYCYEFRLKTQILQRTARYALKCPHIWQNILPFNPVYGEQCNHILISIQTNYKWHNPILTLKALRFNTTKKTFLPIRKISCIALFKTTQTTILFSRKLLHTSVTTKSSNCNNTAWQHSHWSLANRADATVNGYN